MPIFAQTWSDVEPTCGLLAPQCDWRAVTPDSCFLLARCWGRGAAVCGKAGAAFGRSWQRVFSRRAWPEGLWAPG